MDEFVNKYVGSLFKKTKGIGSSNITVAFVTDMWKNNKGYFLTYELYSDSPLVCYAGQKSSSPVDWFDNYYMRIN